jgi:hypothetical protein
MPAPGWKQLLDGAPWFRGEGAFPITAYSEFMPPPYLGCKPYGTPDGIPVIGDDPWGWNVTEYEETLELRPGLENLARQLLSCLMRLGRGRSAHGISRPKLANNPYWPSELAEQAAALKHERYVVILPLSLARTQDDKGRLRWTLFGGSEQGPTRAFWQGFFTAPGMELPEEQALNFLRHLLRMAFHQPMDQLGDLRQAGFRIFDADHQADAAFSFDFWRPGPLPGWTAPLMWNGKQSLRGVRYLLTFRPFGSLPRAVRRAYLAGELHLLPFPGSLVFWGAQGSVRLARELPLAVQIPLLQSVIRHEGPTGIRVPQSGWIHEPRPGRSARGHHGPVRNTFRRTHRWARVHRDEDELAVEGQEEKLIKVLFSTAPDDLGLYGKPMARNVQMWTHELQLLLDGPRADSAALKRACHATLQGGMFGYRFVYPAMRVGLHEVYWHRPLVAVGARAPNYAVLVPDAPLGYLTAYVADRPDLEHPIELWPRILNRKLHALGLHLFERAHDPRLHQTVRNIRKLLDTCQMAGTEQLPRPLARQLLTIPRHKTLDDWLESLPPRAAAAAGGRQLADELRARLAPEPTLGPGRQRLPPSLTFEQTARRSFEVAYWRTIAFLAEGKYVNKDNADCVRDAVTQRLLPHHHRDLEALGDYLLAYYGKTVAAAGMTDQALVGDLPFRWHTDFDFPWSGGWLNNQEGHTCERDLIVVIPGRDRSRAVIMADHYDTAYMADQYEAPKEKGARLAAAGADDNHSATAACMRAAPLFLRMSKTGRLACDIWLIHLTGEEFPADCMGARYLCQQLVQGTLKMRLAAGGEHDLSGVRIQGVYVMDMIAHNNEHNRDVFQISPGTGRQSLWLAYQAHLATEAWNASTRIWNQRPSRRGLGRGRRCPHGGIVPEIAQQPELSGEVRPPYDPRSTLYNTDGQIFSDTGIPLVLFMENYDINRSGYHDSHDTMANIDLDYGAALAAITIETVARAATETPGEFEEPRP